MLGSAQPGLGVAVEMMKLAAVVTLVGLCMLVVAVKAAVAVGGNTACLCSGCSNLSAR